MEQHRPVLRWLRWKKRVHIQERDLCPIKYDMKGINDRFYMAMVKTGKTRADIAELYGMDPSIPIALQQPEEEMSKKEKPPAQAGGRDRSIE